MKVKDFLEVSYFEYYKVSDGTLCSSKVAGKYEMLKHFATDEIKSIRYELKIAHKNTVKVICILEVDNPDPVFEMDFENITNIFGE